MHILKPSMSSFSGNMHVSLAEALEVRGGPLQEEEIWAILNQSAESLQELFRKGNLLLQSCNTSNFGVPLRKKIKYLW